MTPEKTIYIVDDDEDVRRSLQLLLEVCGLAVRAFESGADFLDAVGGLSPGTVLLDLRMEGMDGITVLNELAARRFPWPIIMMTGHGEPDVGLEATAAGAAAFIEKPFDELLLLRYVEEAWARSAAAR